MATQKQIKATEILLKNRVVFGGNITVGQAMIKAGYSPRTAHTPQKLTSTKTYKEIMGDYRIIESLVKAIDMGLKAEKIIKVGNKTTGKSYLVHPDHVTRLKYCDLILKTYGY